MGSLPTETPEVSFLNDISIDKCGDKIFVQFFVAELRMTIPWKIDTGSNISFVSSARFSDDTKIDAQPANLTATTANGSAMHFSKKVQLTLEGGTFQGSHAFYVCDIECRSIIGMDFLNAFKATIDLHEFQLLLGNSSLPLIQSTRLDRQSIYLVEEVTLPPGAQVTAKCSTIAWREDPIFSLLFIPAMKHAHIELDAASLLPNKAVQVTLTNSNRHAKILAKGSRVAHVRAADSSNSIFSIETRLPPSDEEVETLYAKLNIAEKELTSDQQNRVREMLRKCYHAFSHNGEVGEAKIPPIHIKFANDAPVRCKPYRHSESDKKVIREHLDAMVKQGLAVEADGTFSSPLCLIWQKGKSRCVVDYRAVNKTLIPSTKGVIPSIQSQLQKVRPNSIMSIFDLKMAFMNFKIDLSSSSRLAFITEDRILRSTRLPFGLTVSPSECVNAMKTILHGLDDGELIHYVDDLAMVKKNVDLLIASTQALLLRLQEYNVRVNPSKSNLFTRKARLLGHDIDSRGVSVPPEYVEKIRAAPTPRNSKDVQCFLGLVTWVSKFCPFLADAAKPLFALTNVPKKEFKWQDIHDQAFEHIKWQLTNAPCLVHFDDERETELFTDASDTGYSGVLVQVYGEDRKPVAYYSRCVKKNEINYTIYLKEFSSLVASIRHFRPFLIGKPFKVYLDNHAVSYLHSIKISQDSAKVARYIAYLNQYEMEIVRIRSKSNPSDFLSRTRCNSESCFACNTPRKFLSVPFRFANEEAIKPIPIVDKATQTDRRVKEAKDKDKSRRVEPECQEVMCNANVDEVASIELINEQAKDKEIEQLKSWFLQGHLDRFEKQHIQHLSPRQRRLMIWAPQFRVMENGAFGVMFNEHALDRRFKIIVPEQCYEKLIEFTHATTLKHLGAAKTIAYLKDNCILPGVDKIARLCISRCKECATQKAYTQSTRAPKQELYHNEPVGQFIYCDHAGPFPSKSRGNLYVLAIQDMTSKHLALFPQKTVTAEETIRKLLQYMQTYGYVTKMLTDNARSFKNRLMSDFTSSLNIRHLFSSAFFPSANGQIEKANSTVGDLLTILTNYSSPHWADHLNGIAAVYNACQHAAIGVSPNELFYGRRLLLPSTVFTDSMPEVNPEGTTEENILSHLVHLRKTVEKARELNLKNLRISKIYFDRFSGAINRLAVGQQVFLKQPNRHKLQLRYPKPFEVVRKVFDNVYEVRSLEDPSDVRTYNVSRLKPFSNAFLPSSKSSSTQTSSTGVDDIQAPEQPTVSCNTEPNSPRQGSPEAARRQNAEPLSSSGHHSKSKVEDTHSTDGHGLGDLRPMPMKLLALHKASGTSEDAHEAPPSLEDGTIPIQAYAQFRCGHESRQAIPPRVDNMAQMATNELVEQVHGDERKPRSAPVLSGPDNGHTPVADNHHSSKFNVEDVTPWKKAGSHESVHESNSNVGQDASFVVENEGKSSDNVKRNSASDLKFSHQIPCDRTHAASHCD